MYVTGCWFYNKLVLDKAKELASYEAATHTIFFLNIDILTEFISPSSYSNKGVLDLKSFMSSKASLLTGISENLSSNSGFNFAFDLAFSHRNVFFPAVCYLQWENVCSTS